MNFKSIYTFLYHTFYYQTFNYEVYRPKELVVEELDQYFMETSGLLQLRKLNGGFVDYPHTFYISTIEKYPSYMKGVIQDSKGDKTAIEIAVRANEFYFLFFILFALVAASIMLYKFVVTGDVLYVWGFLWLTLFGGGLCVWTARRESKKMRKSFEARLGAPLPELLEK